jgi:hypothetical protein
MNKTKILSLFLAICTAAAVVILLGLRQAAGMNSLPDTTKSTTTVLINGNDVAESQFNLALAGKSILKIKDRKIVVYIAIFVPILLVIAAILIAVYVKTRQPAIQADVEQPIMPETAPTTVMEAVMESQGNNSLNIKIIVTSVLGLILTSFGVSVAYLRASKTKEQNVNFDADADSSSESDGENAPTCSICLEDIVAEDDENLELSCGHKFHANCVQGWISANHTCPNCRGAV